MTDLTITPPAGEAVLAPTARCVVAVRADGIQLASDVLAVPTALDWPELELLAGFSVGEGCTPPEAVRPAAEATGKDRRELRQFVAKCRMGGRLAPNVERWQHVLADHPDLDARGPLPAGDQLVSLRLPIVFLLRERRYEVVHHDGRRIASLEPAEVAALASLLAPTTRAAAAQDLRHRGLAERIDEPALDELLARLRGAGLLRVTSAAGLEAPVDDDAPAFDRDELIREVFARHAAAQRDEEARREADTGVHRTRVVPVAFDMGTPSGLGMVVAAAKAHDGGRLEGTYWFRTDWVWDDALLDELTAEPGVYLFSNYLWSHEQCLEVCRQVKERSPESITIHGGPDTPKYDEDARRHLHRFPHVDVLVRGEGEATTAHLLDALVPVLAGERSWGDALREVPGITFRDGDEVVRTDDRERVADLDSLPSPFLTGIFDVFREVPELFVTLETNRGCPYGCTFCDWGSATTSRVRKFDMERVDAELEWCASAAVSSVSVADSNFGMFERDIDIARKVAQLKRDTGYPPAFGVSYAKNTVRHLEEIIRILSDVGIMAQGVLSLQTMDVDTLSTIRRSNIKTERYDQLAGEMRRSQLPLMIELMMGLPGQTLEAFTDDLQQCIAREVPARINMTTLLVNSPMNDPEYLAEHQIVTGSPVGPGLNANVISTSSFTPDDYREMGQLRRAMIVYENFGMLRIVARFVRQETGVREIDLYARIRPDTDAQPERWPALTALSHYGHALMAPPASWALVMADLGRYLADQLGLEPSPALDAVLAAQQALLPAHGRSFPETIELPHDVVAWHDAMLAAKGTGHFADWPEHTPRLATFGPGTFTVDDPDDIVDSSLGINGEAGVLGHSWEVDSPLSRARIASTQLVDWVSERVMPRVTVQRPQAAEAGTTS